MENQDQLLEQLTSNLRIVEDALSRSSYDAKGNSWIKRPGEDESHFMDASTPMDAIEMATRCISRNDRMKELRENSQFKEAVIRRVMETLQRCGLNQNTREMIKAGKYHASAAEYFHEILKENDEVALSIVEENPDIIKHMPEYFSEQYPETFLYAAERNPEVLQNPEYLKYARQAAEKNPEIFGKRFQKLTEGKDSRTAKEEKLNGLIAEDDKITGAISQARDELGIDDKETSRND